jgi:hypothetical protein
MYSRKGAVTMARPHVGDLCYVQQPGSRERELGIVVGRGVNDTVKVHVFTSTEHEIGPDKYVPFSVTEDGDIPPPPSPEPPPPAKPAPTW